MVGDHPHHQDLHPAHPARRVHQDRDLAHPQDQAQVGQPSQGIMDQIQHQDLIIMVIILLRLDKTHMFQPTIQLQVTDQFMFQSQATITTAATDMDILVQQWLPPTLLSCPDTIITHLNKTLT